jgi:hypothetical protein
LIGLGARGGRRIGPLVQVVELDYSPLVARILPIRNERAHVRARIVFARLFSATHFRGCVLASGLVVDYLASGLSPGRLATAQGSRIVNAPRPVASPSPIVSEPPITAGVRLNVEASIVLVATRYAVNTETAPNIDRRICLDECSAVIVIAALGAVVIP